LHINVAIHETGIDNQRMAFVICAFLIKQLLRCTGQAEHSVQIRV